jgi:hypothetical protein
MMNTRFSAHKIRAVSDFRNVIHFIISIIIVGSTVSAEFTTQFHLMFTVLYSRRLQIK